MYNYSWYEYQTRISPEILIKYDIMDYGLNRALTIDPEMCYMWYGDQFVLICLGLSQF